MWLLIIGAWLTTLSFLNNSLKGSLNLGLQICMCYNPEWLFPNFHSKVAISKFPVTMTTAPGSISTFSYPRLRISILNWDSSYFSIVSLLGQIGSLIEFVEEMIFRIMIDCMLLLRYFIFPHSIVPSFHNWTKYYK